MFNIGFSELIILGVIALVFIGPKELPEIARVIGRFLNELKRTTQDLGSHMVDPNDEIRQHLTTMRETLNQPLIDENDKKNLESKVTSTEPLTTPLPEPEKPKKSDT